MTEDEFWQKEFGDEMIEPEREPVGGPDNVIRPFDVTDDDLKQEEQADAIAAGEKISLDEFKRMFSGGFNVAGAFLKLESLPIKPEEQAGADKTAEKLYYAIDATPYICRLLCNPEALADWYLIGGFLVGKGLSVAAEIRGTTKGDLIGKTAERAGERLADGFLSRFCFWKRNKKHDNDNEHTRDDEQQTKD